MRCRAPGSSLAAAAMGRSPIVRSSKAIWSTGAALAGAGALGSAAAAGIGTPPPAAAPILRETPPRLSASAVARFSFETKGRRVECRLDEGAARPCTSPVEYRVADGAHRFSVSAGSRAAHYAWTVDTSAPDAPRFTEAPGAVSGSTRVRFVVTPSAQCALDGVRVRCAALHEVAEGEHRFTAVVVDAAGNRSAETVHVWRVDTTPPAAPALADGGPPFAFTGEAGATFVCVLDGGPALPCASPHAFTGPLPGGEHTFAVRARDAAGNTGRRRRRASAWTISPTAARRWRARRRVTGGSARPNGDRPPRWRGRGGVRGRRDARRGQRGRRGRRGRVRRHQRRGRAAWPDPADGAGRCPAGSGTPASSRCATTRPATAAILGLNSGGILACRAGAEEPRGEEQRPDRHAGGRLAPPRADPVGRHAQVLPRRRARSPRPPASPRPNAPAAVAPWHVMNNGAVSEQYSRGRADEVAIHTRALTPEQIARAVPGGEVVMSRAATSAVDRHRRGCSLAANAPRPATRARSSSSGPRGSARSPSRRFAFVIDDPRAPTPLPDRRRAEAALHQSVPDAGARGRRAPLHRDLARGAPTAPDGGSTRRPRPHPGSRADGPGRFTLSGRRLSCKLDDGAPEACAGTVEYLDLPPGEHTLTVTARDRAGNASRTEHAWTVSYDARRAHRPGRPGHDHRARHRRGDRRRELPLRVRADHGLRLPHPRPHVVRRHRARHADRPASRAELPLPARRQRLRRVSRGHGPQRRRDRHDERGHDLREPGLRRARRPDGPAGQRHVLRLRDRRALPDGAVDRPRELGLHRRPR